ncbi:YebC/PmpR family DNA-binding transcriptional regulator [Candidatus Peregrinibacteria bacterium]|jgi:YebC/PmpR family DNA-binding regulatory protein|nr:YebC/PmpR family DNA-binding transcriptional regulator [Candidatus Peregrinibacteria bacterium]
MSGHSKWASIKHKKAATDAARGKIFTKHAKLITVAVKEGGGSGDPNTNSSLRLTIENAKKDNMPNNNIERAIKKGTGEDKDSVQLMEVVYEAIGPGGTALMITTLTDNKNRTFPNVRTAVEKKGGTMGAAGSSAWMFEKKGVILASGLAGDDAEMAIIEAGADDYSDNGDGTFEIYTDLKDLHTVREALMSGGFQIEQAEVSFVAKDYKRITDLDTAKKIVALIENVEEDEDVTDVSGNFDIADEVMGEL